MARDFSRSFYRSSEWKNMRSYICKRDKYLCVKCGMPGEEVHHIIHLSPKNIENPEITLNEKNLILLCKNCHFNEHKGEHGNGRKAKEKEESSEYEFDSNGFLVEKKKIAPP